MENSACLGVKDIGKPCALIAHARFDEGGQVKACSLLYRIKSSQPLAPNSPGVHKLGIIGVRLFAVTAVNLAG